MTENQRALRLDIQFDGRHFEGWQIQPPRPGEGQAPRTVQSELEAAARQVTGVAAHALACGRTDAGVSAAQLVVRLRTTSQQPAEALARAIDAVLPDDIGVLSARDVDADFHPVRDAIWKWYRYRILTTRTKRPLRTAFAWHHARPVPFDGLAIAAAALQGTHDFASFGNSGSPRDGTIRTLHHVHWHRDGEHLVFDVVGNGFLYKMVRTLVGTQLDAARSEDPAAWVRRVLAALDRREAGPAVPGAGLTLMHVQMVLDSAPQHLPPALPSRLECPWLVTGDFS